MNDLDRAQKLRVRERALARFGHAYDLLQRFRIGRGTAEDFLRGHAISAEEGGVKAVGGIAKERKRADRAILPADKDDNRRAVSLRADGFDAIANQPQRHFHNMGRVKEW